MSLDLDVTGQFLFSTPCATTMAGRLFKIIGELLLPEKYGNDQIVPEEPLEAFISTYNQLFQLAAQIDSHAETAPYPHIRKRLRDIAAEKRESAQHLKRMIEGKGMIEGGRTSVQEPAKLSVTGKNHWERIGRDLADQRAFENFLARSEPRLSAQYPDMTEFLLKLRNAQVAHREALAELLGQADPQATQT